MIYNQPKVLLLSVTYFLVFAWMVWSGQDFYVDVYGTLFEGAVGEVTRSEALWGGGITGVVLLHGYLLYRFIRRVEQ